MMDTNKMKSALPAEMMSFCVFLDEFLYIFEFEFTFERFIFYSKSIHIILYYINTFYLSEYIFIIKYVIINILLYFMFIFMFIFMFYVKYL